MSRIILEKEMRKIDELNTDAVNTPGVQSQFVTIYGIFLIFEWSQAVGMIHSFPRFQI